MILGLVVLLIFACVGLLSFVGLPFCASFGFAVLLIWFLE